MLLTVMAGKVSLDTEIERPEPTTRHSKSISVTQNLSGLKDAIEGFVTGVSLDPAAGALLPGKDVSKDSGGALHVRKVGLKQGAGFILPAINGFN